MKETIESLLIQALEKLISDGLIETLPALQITRTKDAAHGDFTCNVAMMLAKQAGKPPRDVAQAISEALDYSESPIEKIEIAGPGFINFFMAQESTLNIINDIITSGDRFGESNAAKGEKVQIEFVSANPTGPLHVGHGRGAAYGATLASLMRAVGFVVDCEYYVNDAGRQMNILATSVWLRYLELNGIELTFPVNGYKGDYIFDIAESIKASHGDNLVFPATEIFHDIHSDEPEGGDKEKHIDDLITRARHLLGSSNYQLVFKAGLNSILDDIRLDLEEFGVTYQNWYSEQTLSDRGLIDKAVEQLQLAGHVEERNGALWFLSTKFGDEKDRVIIRDNGQATYFASDIAYHMDKFARGYQRAINIWGADHHGYVARVKAAIGALGKQGEDLQDRLDILLVQFANLYRGGERVQMSTRSGSFVTLRELREEVGTDAARFFYVMRKCEQHMDFDLDLAKSQSNDNPVYYIQYAHARICSVINQLTEKELAHDIENGFQHLNLLTEKHETELISKLDAYSDIVHKAAFNAEPHLLVHYLRELANLLHSYYNAHQFINDDTNLHDARFNLIIATRQVLKNGLTLLGVSAPAKM
ncbi:MAG: arginine--tRNA ligase [Gammaproteobacteria bacterium]|nr:arginine--tRNA ligase [Gammaproteobacteria bacterium]NNJ48749.1 arginine--tRNA ligase [Gammaproteobacteria bacterium]